MAKYRYHLLVTIGQGAAETQPILLVPNHFKVTRVPINNPQP
jgi:hypothetical protein